MDLARQDLDPYGVAFIDGRAEAAQDDGTDWIVRTADGAAVRGRHVVVATLYALQRDGKVKGDVVAKAIADLGIDPERDAPVLR